MHAAVSACMQTSVDSVRMFVRTTINLYDSIDFGTCSPSGSGMCKIVFFHYSFALPGRIREFLDSSDFPILDESNESICERLFNVVAEI